MLSNLHPSQSECYSADILDTVEMMGMNFSEFKKCSAYQNSKSLGRKQPPSQ